MTPRKGTAPVIFQGLEAGLKMFRWVVVILLALFCVSGFQKIESGNVGLQLRFGKLHGNTPGEQVKAPGLLVALPHPIDKVIKVPIKQEAEVVIDEVYHESEDQPATDDEINPVLEGYCLTGDQSIIQARLTVRYKIIDPVAFELWADPKDRDAILGNVVLASLVHTLAGWDVDDALRLQRPDPRSGDIESLALTVRRLAQARLDRLGEPDGVAGCGMEISAVAFDKKNPPRHVKADFEQVNSARIAKRTVKNQAVGQAAGLALRAEAEKNRMKKEATAKHDTLKAKAHSELSVFQKAYAQYQENPRLVLERSYLETLEQIMNTVKTKYFVDPETRVILKGEDQP